jgi:hypothetical protein
MYYTYLHSTSDGSVFYVGKGREERAYTKHDRSVAWKEHVKKSQGYAVSILADWPKEEEAFEHEKFLISCFKDMGHNLLNLTSGGKGPNDYCQTKELREHKRQLMTGFAYKKVTCPECGKEGGETAMKRWHFDKCAGVRPFKARATKNGVRVYLGYYATKEQADSAIKAFKGTP